MTAPWRDVKHPEPAVNAWVRTHPRLDSARDGCATANIDMSSNVLVWHRYAIFGRRDVQCLMGVEIKTFGADLSPSERDTLNAWNASIRTVTKQRSRSNGRLKSGHHEWPRKVKSIFGGRLVTLKNYGMHVWRLSGSNPDDSEWMTWDGKTVSMDQIVSLFLYELHPDTLLPDNPARPHKPIPRFPLFEPVGNDGTQP